jgi:uracil phosphoribosyltransferase
MKVHHIAAQNSILNNFLAELRDENIQRDSMRFRRNLERIGEILSYEMSKQLVYTPQDITTPLGMKEVSLPEKDIVLCSILRAGLPLHQGILNYFDAAENAFISAYRKVHEDGSFDIKVEYFASPSLEGKTLILADPMLATGRSLVSTYEALLSHGKPREIHIFSIIGSTEGIDYVAKHFPDEVHLWIADYDDQLNKKGYIVPGLGDAGDLAFGSKL